MKREEIAQKIHWTTIIWGVGMVNVVAMLPQLYQLLTTHETGGLNVGMFWIYFWVQVAFSLEGYFTRNTMLMWSLGLSAVVSSLTIIAYYTFSP